MGKLERVLAAARGIVPPSTDSTPHEVRCWRLNVFIVLIVLVVVTVFHLASAGGYLESVGINGVAHASEVQQNGKTARAILRRMALPEIRAKIRRRCMSTDFIEKERINRDLDRLLEQFKTDTGEDFGHLPDCSEV